MAMAKRNTFRNYAKESDPEFNRQFRRLWTEPLPKKTKGQTPRAKRSEISKQDRKAA